MCWLYVIIGVFYEREEKIEIIIIIKNKGVNKRMIYFSDG